MDHAGEADPHPDGKEGDESSAGPTTAKKRKDASANALAELMSNKKHKASAAATGGETQFFLGRNALGTYLVNPAAYLLEDAAQAPAGPDGPDVGGRVLFFTDEFVAVHDKYPKSSVHCLLLPRSRRFTRMPPLALLSRQDETTKQFLGGLRAATERLRQVVASELRRRFGAESAQDAAREAFLRGEGGKQKQKEGDDDDGQPPPGRDWASEVRVGVHAHPSMNHLHVHVLSRDMHSACVKKRSHYNSFTTAFLMPLETFPADETGQRVQYSELVHGGMVCWRCGRNFGNQLAQLKRHLDEEFEAWKRE